MLATLRTLDEDFRYDTKSEFSIHRLTHFLCHIKLAGFSLLQVALYTSLKVSGPPIACSEAMFVHNNSKHGRNVRPMPPYRDAVVGDGKTYYMIITIEH